MGGGTLLVSLPKEWTRKNGVIKGSTLSVEEVSGRTLVVRPIEDVVDKPREVVIEYPQEDVAHVLNDLTGAYLLGYDNIKIQGSRMIGKSDREQLKTSIGRLIGLEIMDEDSKQMTVNFLLESAAVDPEKMARRICGIIEGMLKDTVEGIRKGDAGVLASVAERDDEVDRLYFLLVRTIRTATMRTDLAERYGLTPVEVLDYRVLASYLESIGDAMVDLSKRLAGSHLPRASAKGYVECLSKLGEMEELAIQGFMGRRSGKSRGAYLNVHGLSAEVGDLLASLAEQGASSKGQAVEALGSMERISKLLVDISDLAAPSQDV